MTQTSSLTAVVADIGGTNTRVALAKGAQVQPESIRRFRNADHAGIVSVLTTYLAEADTTVDAACVAMAGPVSNGVGTLTNLDWVVDRTEIAAATGARTVAVLNDLQAQGHALNHMQSDCFSVIRTGTQAEDGATKLVVGVGTGLNAALVFFTDSETIVPPSESGHVNLPVQTEQDLRLLSYLARDHGLPGAEEALSGRGIVNLYDFACEETGIIPQFDTAAEIMNAVGSDLQARMAAQQFVTLLGRIVGNLALIQLPFGGIYLCGGVARAVTAHLEKMGFEEAFLDKGRFSEFLEQFPVSVVTDDYAALTGSACHLSELIAKSE